MIFIDTRARARNDKTRRGARGYVDWKGEEK